MKWLRVFIVSLIIGLAATSIIVAASDITMAQYRGTILIVNSDSAATNVCVPVSGLNTGALVSEGYVWSNYTNTNVAMAAGTDVAYMPNAAANSTIIFLPSVTQSTSTEAYLYTGGTQAMNSTLAYFPQTNPMTTTLGIALGYNYTIEISGGFIGNANADIFTSLPANLLKVYQVGGQLTAIFSGGAGLTTPTITGDHIINITSNATTVTLSVDGVPKSSGASISMGTPSGTSGINPTTMYYMRYQKIWVDGVLKQDIRWNPGATFTDLSGNGHDATPTFRTTSSNANVTATLTGFEPISQAVATSSTLYSAPDLLHPYNMTGNFTAPINATFPGADIIVALSEISSTPSQLPLLIISAFLTIVIGLSLSAMLKKYNSISMAIKISATSLCMMVGIWTKVDDYWMLIVYWILAAALALLARR